MIIIAMTSALVITSASAGYMAWRLHRCERYAARRTAERDQARAQLVQATQRDVMRVASEPIGTNVVSLVGKRVAVRVGGEVCNNG